MEVSLDHQAQSLLSRISSHCASGQPFGSFSASIYDTAWLSMIRMPDFGNKWMFPECFDYLLRTQQPDGSWKAYATIADGILNTAAGLLALKEHRHDDLEDGDSRCHKAESSLRAMLASWNVNSTDQVGFEILVMKHLSLLQEHGVDIDFPHLPILSSLYQSKLAKIPMKHVYKAPSTLYHSLEAFVGQVEYDKTRAWRESNGSMLGSPSSTAAYLMKSSTWDHDAEAYLRMVVEQYEGSEKGGVPSAWPTTIFETSWVITTLIDAGVTVENTAASILSQFLEEALEKHGGIVGFSPSALPDVDDTAKAYLALHQLGKSISVGPLVERFESNECFVTYPGERNPSLSANINVLICLLSQEDMGPYGSQIEKTLKFICNHVWVGQINEKWNQSELYWIMLLLEAFRNLYKRHDDLRRLTSSSNIISILEQQVPLISLHALIRIRNMQADDGSWSNACETTAYAVLALSSFTRIPLKYTSDDLKLAECINRGQLFLQRHRDQWSKGRYLWIEKVTYACDIISEAYCLSALIVSPSLGTDASSLHPVPFDSTTFAGIKKASQLIARTPLFSDIDSSVLHAAVLQAGYLLQDLRERHLEVFPRTGMAEDKYLTFIPLTWTACSALVAGTASLEVIREMIHLSMLTFQADEFMETSLGRDFPGDMILAGRLVEDLFNDSDDHQHNSNGNGCTNGRRTDIGAVQEPLRRFINHILKHPAVLRSSQALQNKLLNELKTYLQAHITQAADNRVLKQQRQSSGTCTTHQVGHPNRTFYEWVRSTSADHTSCPFAFIFFNCLVTKPLEKGVLDSVETAYVAEDLCRHLATLCRMYNDWGSIERDRDELNLNSVDFPEFYPPSPGDVPMSNGAEKHRVHKDEQEAKVKLMWVAQYERRGLETAFAELDGLMGPCGLTQSLRLFIAVTDLYGQIYVEKDIATRMV